MLREILASLSEGKTLSQYDLAERLRTTPEAVAARIDFLRRAGYLRETCAAGNCGGKCAGCPMANAARGNPPAVWEAAR
jgi:DNA-binding Lrp family transcriptional regulator